MSEDKTMGTFYHEPDEHEAYILCLELIVVKMARDAGSDDRAIMGVLRTLRDEYAPHLIYLCPLSQVLSADGVPA